MHLSRVDLNLLVVLDAIFAESGITRAAAKLHLTQPAISHALGRLRTLFGDPLFVREGRTMVPTPFARNLIVPVRRALRSLELTLNELERFDPATTPRRFVLGVRDVLESVLLPPLMQRIGEAAPQVEVAVVQADRRALEAELAGGGLDVAIDVLLPLGEQVRRQRVVHDRMVVMARRGHPALRGRLDLERYLAQDHILVSSRRSGPGLEDLELSRHGLRRRVRLRCQHYFPACHVVGRTDFVLTMPEGYARVANAHFGHRILPFPLPAPVLDAYLYWHANVENEPANRWLRESILRAFARPGARRA